MTQPSYEPPQYGQQPPHGGQPDQGQPSPYAPPGQPGQPGQPDQGQPSPYAPPGQPSPYAPPGQPSYGQPDYGQQQPPSYGQPTYGQPAYGQPQPDSTQALPQYGQSPYDQPPTSGGPSYGAPTSGGPQYGAPTSGAPQYGEPQYGAGQYGAPQYGAPQYDQPAYGVPGQVPPSGKTNGFAIASLIFGVVGGILLSVIFSFIAFSQIKKRGDKGKGLAIGGLVASGVWLVLGCVIGVVLIIAANNKTETDPLAGLSSPTTTSSSSPKPQSSKETSTPVEDLKVGQCVNGINNSGDTLRRLPVVACAAGHEGEVVSIFNLTGSTYPGDTQVDKQAQEKCFAELDKYSPSTKDDQTISIFYLHPTKTTWATGDREVICMAMFEKPRTGSIKG